MKLVLTGGHLTPAYTLGEYALAHSDQVWYFSNQPSASVEAQEVTKLGMQYIQINHVKFDRYHPIKSIIKLPLLLNVILDCRKLMADIKPNCVVTFGGFNAIPVAVAAKIMGVPIVLHEQTRTLGLANKAVSLFSAANAISYPETKAKKIGSYG